MKMLKEDSESKQEINTENMERNKYHNMSEEKQQKLKEYQKNYRDAKRYQSNN